MSTVLAVDGGNSKTDLAIVDIDGTVLAAVRGPGSSPHHVGVAGSVERIGALYDQAMTVAGRAGRSEVGVFMLAGVDLNGEEEALHVALSEQLGQIRETPISDSARSAVEHEQPARAALGERRLRDKVAREVVLEVAPQHAGRNSTRRAARASRRPLAPDSGDAPRRVGHARSRRAPGVRPRRLGGNR